jgi:hypothetical protein
MTSVLDREIETFNRMKADLEQHHNGKFVVIRDSDLIDAFDTFDAAAGEAVRRFGRGPYLIRQVGALPPVLPASVLFREAAWR